MCDCIGLHTLSFVINIVSVTVYFLILFFFSSKLFLSQPALFAFCVPSYPLQPPAEGRSRSAARGFWSLGAGDTKLQSTTPKPCHVVMLPQEAFHNAAAGNFNCSTINKHSSSLFHSSVIVHDES